MEFSFCKKFKHILNYIKIAQQLNLLVDLSFFMNCTMSNYIVHPYWQLRGLPFRANRVLNEVDLIWLNTKLVPMLSHYNIKTQWHQTICIMSQSLERIALLRIHIADF